LTLAKKRLLNEPYFLILFNLSAWLVSALVLTVVVRVYGEGWNHVLAVVVLDFLNGLITATAAFFILQWSLQKFLAPVFFPHGRLWATPGTLRHWIGVRLSALITGVCVIPFAVILTNIWISSWSNLLTAQGHLMWLRKSFLADSLIFVAVGVLLAYLMASNISRPLNGMISVLKKVKNGDFQQRVRVFSNDELGYAGDVINDMTEGLAEREVIRDVFGKYVAQEVRDEVLSGRIPLDGEKKEVSILFADLRDFTPLTESNPPKLIVQVLNLYFKEMAQAVEEQGGSVLQFLGDEVYAVFGAPVSRQDHPIRAFKAGLEMNRRLDLLNQSLSEQGLPRLRHGIGIHSGPAVAANIGSPDRLSYLLVGDTINLAARLQQLTKKMSVRMLISAHTHALLHLDPADADGLARLPDIEVKGISRPVEVYAVR
jgi:adenylate cyclase